MGFPAMRQGGAGLHPTAAELSVPPQNKNIFNDRRVKTTKCPTGASQMAAPLSGSFTNAGCCDTDQQADGVKGRSASCCTSGWMSCCEVAAASFWSRRVHQFLFLFTLRETQRSRTSGSSQEVVYTGPCGAWHRFGAAGVTEEAFLVSNSRPSARLLGALTSPAASNTTYTCRSDFRVS